MAGSTVTIKEKSYEEFYEETERNGVGGIMLVFVIWLLIFNPLYTIFHSNFIIFYLHKLSVQMNYPLAGLVFCVNQVLMFGLIVAGIVLGYRVNKLYKGSLELSKLYMVIHTAFLLTMVFVINPVILKGIETHVIDIASQKKLSQITRLLANMNFRIWTSLVVFGVWYGYLSCSKQAKALFYPD
jgi:hypothetical protein